MNPEQILNGVSDAIYAIELQDFYRITSQVCISTISFHE